MAWKEHFTPRGHIRLDSALERRDYVDRSDRWSSAPAVTDPSGAGMDAQAQEPDEANR